ncbi:MAG: hypothetical protein K0R54_853 [Clostridiaceae bacterium]|jgi:transcriptional regulatory protein LevR|nr:hypothetical protein [Clostridiaceae bacterium]
MELDMRLDILKQANQIDEDIYNKLKDVIKMIEHNHGIKLNEENGAMLITHLSVALMRIKNQQLVNNADEEIFNEIKCSEFFNSSNEVIEDIQGIIHMEIPECEKDFIIMHLCTLFTNMKNK